MIMTGKQRDRHGAPAQRAFDTLLAITATCSEKIPLIQGRQKTRKPMLLWPSPQLLLFREAERQFFALSP